MNYEPLARKYRPKNFKEVVGQDHVVSALSNAINSGRIHHAYLFAGTRGVGKTTMARILAKSLECLSSPSPTTKICGVCDACRGIAAGNFVDVQEIDGASNRGIDEIRNLRENVRYAPVVARYKIFTIDEAHQITGAAFNALLKTLEEPPKHAVFILATTEALSIPPTIASRCQRYRFKSIPEKVLSDTLKKILSEEKIPFEDAAVSILARAAQGSMRDAESLAEQAIAFTGHNITVAGVRELLGILPSEMIGLIFEALSSGDARRLIEVANEIMDDGYEPGVIFADMLSVLRAMIYIVSGAVPPRDGGVSDFEKEIAARYVSSFNLEKILRMSKIILKARDEMRWTEDIRFLAEIYLAKIIQPVLTADEILSAVSTIEGGTAPPSREKLLHHPPAQQTHQDSRDPSKTEGSPSKAGTTRMSDDKTPSAVGDEIYRKLLSAIPSSEERLRACLADVNISIHDGKSITLIAPSEFYANSIKRKIEVIVSSLEKVTGIRYEIEVKWRGAKNNSPDAVGYAEVNLQSTCVATDSSSDLDKSESDNLRGEYAVDTTYYEESIFDAPSDRDSASFPEPTAASGASAEQEFLPEGIKKIKDIFQGRVLKLPSSKLTPRERGE